MRRPLSMHGCGAGTRSRPSASRKNWKGSRRQRPVAVAAAAVERPRIHGEAAPGAREHGVALLLRIALRARRDPDLVLVALAEGAAVDGDAHRRGLEGGRLLVETLDLEEARLVGEEQCEADAEPLEPARDPVGDGPARLVEHHRAELAEVDEAQVLVGVGGALEPGQDPGAGLVGVVERGQDGARAGEPLLGRGALADVVAAHQAAEMVDGHLEQMVDRVHGVRAGSPVPVVQGDDVTAHRFPVTGECGAREQQPDEGCRPVRSLSLSRPHP